MSVHCTYWDPGSPFPDDGDFFDARPDAVETEEAISKFMSGLESQEHAHIENIKNHGQPVEQ